MTTQTTPNNPKSAPAGEPKVRSSAWFDCQRAMEREMDEAEKRMNFAVAAEKYGDAEYHQGQRNAYAIASLSVKHYGERQSNAGAKRRAPETTDNQKS